MTSGRREDPTAGGGSQLTRTPGKPGRFTTWRTWSATAKRRDRDFRISYLQAVAVTVGLMNFLDGSILGTSRSTPKTLM